MGRLKPGVTLEAAGAELTTISQQMEREHPEEDRGSRYEPGACVRRSSATRAVPDPAAGRGRLRAAHRLRERRQPAARARARTPAGTRGPRRARREPAPPRRPRADRRPCARVGWRVRRGGRRVVRGASARGAHSEHRVHAEPRAAGHRRGRAALRGRRGRGVGADVQRHRMHRAPAHRPHRRARTAPRDDDAGRAARGVRSGRRGDRAGRSAARVRGPDARQLQQAAVGRRWLQPRPAC